VFDLWSYLSLGFSGAGILKKFPSIDGTSGRKETPKVRTVQQYLSTRHNDSGIRMGGSIGESGGKNIMEMVGGGVGFEKSGGRRGGKGKGGWGGWEGYVHQIPGAIKSIWVLQRGKTSIELITRPGLKEPSRGTVNLTSLPY